MTIDKQKLKALAESMLRDEQGADFTEEEAAAFPQEVRDFESMTRPAAILALLAEIEHAWREAGNECRDWAREVERRQEVQRERDQFKAENEALRKDAGRWAFFKDLSCQIQAFPHSWGQMTPEKMDFMCDEAMAKESSHD